MSTTTARSSYEELNRRADKLQAFTTANPCPDYCSLPAGHPADSIHDDGPVRQSRGHGGPTSEFGPSVSGGSIEFTDEPGIFHSSVCVDHSEDIDDPGQLRDLAGQIAAAAKWLEAH